MQGRSTSPTVEVPQLDAGVHAAGHDAVRILMMEILRPATNTQSIST